MTKRRGAKPLAKITVRLEAGSWHGHDSESVWAEALGGGRYRVRNVPFFAKGLAVEDVVFAREEEGDPVVDRVLVRSGHSTYRAFLADRVEVGSLRFQQAWQPLAELGCSFERATEHLLAIDVPRNADLQRAYMLLAEGERNGIWEFEEGHAAV